MPEESNSPLCSKPGSGGERDSTPPRILGTPPSTISEVSTQEMDTDETSSGGSSWISNSSDQILPQGPMPRELTTPEVDIDVEARYWRIVFRDRRNIIQFFGLNGNWEEAGELDEDSYFIGRRLHFE